jgi:hypothetical protein
MQRNVRGAKLSGLARDSAIIRCGNQSMLASVLNGSRHDAV